MSTRTRCRFGVGVVAALTLSVACGGSEGAEGTASAESSCETGAERCECYANGTCNDGLSCFSNKCVSLDEGDTGEPVSDDESDEAPSDGEEGSTSESQPEDNDDEEEETQTTGSSESEAPPTDIEPSDSESEAPDDAEPLTPDTQEPYALGVVTVAESHPAKGAGGLSFVSAYFVPHVDPGANATACAFDVGPCTMARTPDCGDCGEDEVCGFDTDCQPKCQALCSLSCTGGDVCYFDAAGDPACGPIEEFDAGELQLRGATQAVSMTSPYSFSATSALFESGATLELSAEGAKEAGFAAFEQTFVATQLLETGLAGLNRKAVFGTDDLVITWSQGADDMALTFIFTWEGGTAMLSCPAKDSDGEFTLPRDVIEEVRDGEELLAINVSLARSRTQLVSGFETQGSLDHTPVAPAGWLRLGTSSSENQTYQACVQGLVECGEECADVETDENNCGECGNVCPSVTLGCQQGECVCYDSDTLCGDECVYLVWDALHCGACDVACGANEICDDSKCVECPSGTQPCDGVCLNLQDNQENCGTCGNLCEKDCGDYNCVGTCIEGTCLYEGDPLPNGDEWNCEFSYYGDGEDCDCGCGSPDPDCSSVARTECEFCYCNLDDEEDCADVAENDNAQCVR